MVRQLIITVCRLLIVNRPRGSPGVNLTLTVDPRLDKDGRVVVPRWSHSPEEMLVDQAEYDLARVSLTSISLVTTKTIKVKRRPFLMSTLCHVLTSFRWNRTQSWNAI